MSTSNCRCLPAPLVDEPETDEPAWVIHHWCCDPYVALCGTKISDPVIVEEAVAGPDDCAMCMDMILTDAECSTGCHERHGITS